MQSLNIEKTYRVLLGDVNRFRIMLVGCGGTGSTLALFLAGLAFHAQQKGIQIDLTLVDHDHVDTTNPGRQNFAPVEAVNGFPKVSSLATRLSSAYGLAISAWPVRYEAGLASDWFDYNAGGQTQAHLIIGCVDSHRGRQEIAKTVETFHGRIYALDSGNAEFNGQILMGNLIHLEQIKLDRLGLCTGLPSPYVQEPGLLEPEEAQQALSCAEMMLREEQSLMINRLAAAIAAQFVTDFVLNRQVMQMGAVFNLDPTVMRPILITQANINQCQKKRRP